MILKLNEQNKIEELKKLLKEHTYLTSDSFQSPDRTYIFLEDDKIKFMDFGDIVSNFNINIYENICFRRVERKYEILLLIYN